MRPSSTAHRYAEAAFDVASQTGAVQAWLQDLRTVEDRLRDQRLNRYFRDPNVPRNVKYQALQELFPGVRPEVLNLLRLLAGRDRLGLVPAIRQDMQRLDREARGVAEATVTVARQIDEGEANTIAQRLSAATGKSIELDTKVDPSIIGGIVVQIGDRLVDASVSGRLERLRQELASS